MNYAGNMAKKITFDVTAEGCFEVTSHRKDCRGYARCGRFHKSYFVHRHVYEQCFGEIPKGMEVCHHCDNPSCINPEHLFLGTHRDNMRDMLAKGRNHPGRGEESGMAKLTELQVKQIRQRYKPRSHTDGMYALAAEFRIGTSTVGQIVSRKRWAWL